LKTELSNKGLERTRHCVTEPRRSTQCWADRTKGYMGSVMRCTAGLRGPGPQFAAVGAIFLTACQAGWRHSQDWRKEQETLIALAIVHDLATMRGDASVPRGTALCVYDTSDAAAPRDPDPRLIVMLRERGLDAYPVSQCDGWKLVGTSATAVHVGVEALEWTDDSFVKAEGGQVCGVLCGGTWLYTLSRDSGGWSVDTVRMNKIF
jgi:hypothetical protein